jgi:hypothetical protein
MRKTTITDQSISTTNDSDNLSSNANIAIVNNEIKIHSVIQNHSIIQANSLKTSALTKELTKLEPSIIEETSDLIFNRRKEILSSIEEEIEIELERLKQFLINKAMHLDAQIVNSDRDILQAAKINNS